MRVVPPIEYVSRSTYSFFSAVAIEPGCSLVPGGDDTVQVVRKNGVTRLLDLQGEQAIFLLALAQRPQQGLEIVGHAVERLDTLCCFRRAVQGNADSIVALAKATSTRGQGMQRAYATAQYQKRHPKG